MALHVTGVVALAANQPTEQRTIVVPDPGPNDVVVRVQACGVCHTDLHYRNGGINDDFPFLLGHEAAGLVETIGDQVTKVASPDAYGRIGNQAGTEASPVVLGDYGIDPPTGFSVLSIADQGTFELQLFFTRG